MSDEQGRNLPGYRFPHPEQAAEPAAAAPVDPEALAAQVELDFTRIEQALARLEQAVRDALEQDPSP